MKKLDTVNNPLIKTSAFHICQDWMNLIEQSTKLVREYDFIASKEVTPHLNKQQDFVDKIKAELKTIKQKSNHTVQEYKRLQNNFSKSHQELEIKLRENAHGLEARQTVEYLKRVKGRDKERLFNQNKVIMQQKNENQFKIKSIVNRIEVNQAQLGDFFIDLGMKNFILQVNYLKNREYDINQLIESFKKKNDNKFNYDEDPSKNTQPPQPVNQIHKFKLPFTLETPNSEFMNSLDNTFYKNVHHDLLYKNKSGGSNSSGGNMVLQRNLQTKKDYKNFEHEAVILSKLFDNKTLVEVEKNVIRNLFLKEKPDLFLCDFFKSFMKYKMDSIFVKEELMLFFMLEIVEKIFIEFIRQRNYEPMFKLIKIFQFIKIYSEINKTPQTKKSKIMNLNKSRPKSRSRTHEPEDYTDFKFWINDKNMSAQHVLCYKQFWIYSLDQIFSNFNRSGLISNRSLSPNQTYIPHPSKPMQYSKNRFPSLNQGTVKPKILKKFSLGTEFDNNSTPRKFVLHLFTNNRVLSIKCEETKYGNGS
jgi:hypothetical protein